MQDAWLQASAANYTKSAIFCDITRRVVAIFTYVSGQPNGPSFNGEEIFLNFLILEGGTVSMSRNVGKDFYSKTN